MKTKIHVISALLTLLPTVLFGGGDKHYYAALKVSVKSGAGKVYAATSSTAESNRNYSKNGNTTSKVDSKNAASGSVGPFYAYAKPDVGWKFVKWTNTSGKLVSEKAEYGSFTLVASSEEDKTLTTEYQAYFEQLPPATITFAAPVNGSYTVNNEAVSAQLVKSNQSVPYSVTLAATPAANFKFGGWYTEENGVKKIFSQDLTTTEEFNEDATVGALFIPDGYAIYAAAAGKGYNNLSEALSEARSGEVITIFDNVTLQDSALIRVGVTLTVSSGVTLTVNGTLTVAGKLVNEGTVNGSGTLRKISYLIDQNEQSLQILHAPDGSEYGEITETHHDGIKPRYYKTEVTVWTPSVSGTINTATQAWGVLLNGENVYAINAQSVKGVSVTLNTSIAVNKIASITGSLTSPEIQKGDTSSKNWVVFGDCSLKGPAHTSDDDRLNFQGTIDLCGNTLTFGLGRTYSDFAPLILNGKVSFTPGTDFQNAAGVFFNCSSVKITNIKGKCYFHFYDCGSEASLADLVFGYQSTSYRYAYVYGGYYKFGIETSSLFGSSTTYGFNSGQDVNYVKIYGGSFLDDPSDYRENKNTLVVLNPNSENNSSEYYLVTSLTSPAQKVAKINDKEYASLQTAINEANANETIVLINPCDFESTTIQIPQEKSIILSLDGYVLSGSKIVNNGALTITDSTTGVGLSNTDVSSGIVSCGIENYGTLDLVFGSYSGAIVNKSDGTLTTHNGLFTGTLTKDAGMVNLRGGHFTADVTALATLPNSKVFHMNNLYTVCEVPNGTMYDTTVKGMAGYGATPYPVTDDHTLLKTRYVSNKSGRSDYSANNWKRLAELMAFYQLFNNHGLDPTLVFDRYVVKDSVNLAAASGSSEQYSELYLDVPAGTPYRALTEKLIRGTNPATGKPWASKTYKAILEEDLTSVAVAVTDKGASGNAGTLCKAMIELWESERAQDYSSTGHKITNTVHVAGQKLFTLGAGSNKAMIRPATGAATFYETLGDAMNAATDGGTVMLANDCDTALPLNKVGTYTFDTMGFAHSEEYSLGEGLVLKSVMDEDSSAKVLVADAVAKKYVVARKITVPTAVSGLVYDGTVKTGVVAAGTGYTLSGNTATAVGSYTATATLDANYVWEDESTGTKTIEWSIVPAPLTVTATAVSKTYGQTDPALTYTVEGLLGEDSMSGELARAVGEGVGTYAINQGNLTAGSNYAITYTGANFTIAPPDSVAKVVIDHVPDAWMEANGFNSNSSAADVQTELCKNDGNGIAKWENVVMGQNGAKKPAIETSTNGTVNVADIVVSFTPPSDIGYTVKYVFDEVDVANGDKVLVEGTVQDKPQLDLTKVAAAGEPHYFKMRTVLESTDQTVTSEVPVEHTVGVMKVASDATFTILAVPWKSFDGGNVKVSELVHAASLSTDDMLYAYDGNGNLKSWCVKGGVWVPATDVVDGAETPKSDPAAFGLARGKGVWLKREDTTKPIYLMGMPSASDDTATTTLAAPASGETSWNLLASPKFKAVDFSKFGTGDEIIVPTGGTPKHYTYKNGVWGYPGVSKTEEKTLPNGKKVTVITTEHKTGDTTIAPGTGFWYLNKGGEKKIEW